MTVLLPMLFVPTPVSAKTEDMRGVWIATVYSINFPSAKNNVAAQKAELDKIVENTYNAGLNTIFFQVRPQGDALYRSSVYPWSEVLTGVAGKDPGYDPLEYIISAAKKKGIEIHAWINPYRITTGSVSNPKTDINALPANHPVLKNPSMAVAFDDGKLYLDPGNPDAQKLVLDGVREILENYDVAGIHFDDYFYPSPSVSKDGKTYNAKFNDDATYAKYGKGKSLEDWRRNNTYTLVKDTYNLVKKYGSSKKFGVAPSGIWDNKKTNAQGSDTNGFSSYSKIYADSRKWVKDGIVDYICPQVYWQIGAKDSDYKIVTQWWNDVCKNTGVDLYIGQAAYRVEAWKSSDEIINQLKFNKTLSEVKGNSFYGYEQIEKNTLSLKSKLADYYGAGSGGSLQIPPSDISKDSLAKPATQLVIASPVNGSLSYSAKSYIMGSGIKGAPIYVNGKEIERTESGHFAMYVDLKIGENTFNFEHNGKKTKYTITRKLYASAQGEESYSPAAYASVKDLSGLSIVGTIISEEAVMRTSNSSSADRKTPMVKGFTDYIVAESPSYYKFRSGGWTMKSNVKIKKSTLSANRVSDVKSHIDELKTTFMWRMPIAAMHTITEMVDGIEIKFHNTKGSGAIELSKSNPIFSSMTFKQLGNDAVYKLNTKKERYLFGYEVKYQDGYVKIEFNNPLSITSNAQPLLGKVIHLDSGHGGTDSGATGPLGKDGPREADLNMAAMLILKSRLEALGARIVTTNEDVSNTVSPEKRQESVKGSNADIGISIHHNSVDSSVNGANVSGTETLYSQPLSRRLADTIQRNLVAQTGAVNRGVKFQSLFMCRFREMPTVLVELGFVSNPYEYEKLTNKEYINKEIDGIVNGILEYMKY